MVLAIANKRGLYAPSLALLRSFTSLPVIDISPLVETKQDEKAKRGVAEALHRACRDVGFFYVKNHGVPPTTCANVLHQARSWFALPAEIKQQIALSSHTHFRGYQELGSNVTRFDGGFQRDWHEAIDLYKEVDPSSPQARGAFSSPVHGYNQWPTQSQEFTTALKEYVQSCLHLGEALMRGIALGLGLPERTFERPEVGSTNADSSYWVSRVIHYPPLIQGMPRSTANAPRDVMPQLEELERSVQLSCGEHSDYGLLTLVNQEDHVTALQAKNASGQWISAAPIPGTFVCNIGDMLRVWTNGLYQPTAHRVINADPTASRVSIPFFYEPAFEAVVKPLPQLCTAERPACIDPIRYGTHLENKVLQNFELDPEDAAVGA